MDIFGEGQYPVSVDYLIALQEFAAEKGVSANRLLANTGLSPSVLVRRGSRIGHLSMDQVVRNVDEALNDPLFPIEYGKRLTISKHGELGYAAQSANTLREAAFLIEQYFNIRSGGGEEFQYIEHEEYVAFRIWPISGEISLPVLRFQMLSTLFSIETIGRWLAGVPANVTVPSQMLFSFAFPWPVPVNYLSPGLVLHFDQPVNELRLAKSLMGRPLTQANPDLAQVARLECEGEAARLKELNSIVWQVREYIHANLGKPTTLEPVACALGVSPRTLKRRLQEAATTFQDIKDSERFRQAMHRLEMSQDSLETIGYELGYSDASNFAKAFRSWSGISPGEYRERVMNSVNSASAAQSLTKET